MLRFILLIAKVSIISKDFTGKYDLKVWTFFKLLLKYRLLARKKV